MSHIVIRFKIGLNHWQRFECKIDVFCGYKEVGGQWLTDGAGCRNTHIYYDSKPRRRCPNKKLGSKGTQCKRFPSHNIIKFVNVGS